MHFFSLVVLDLALTVVSFPILFVLLVDAVVSFSLALELAVFLNY
jgi:hypothetical protein